MESPQKPDLPPIIEVDIEQYAHDTSYLNNNVVQSLAWKDVTVTVPDRETKLPKEILGGVNGYVAAGKSHASLFHIPRTTMRSTFRMELCLYMLILSRRNDGYYGTLGLRQNNAS
jgi:hypothetical protein